MNLWFAGHPLCTLQIMKVAVAPTVIVLEFVLHGKRQSLQTIMSVAVVCAGITIATITDPITVKNTMGLVVGVAATCATALVGTLSRGDHKPVGRNKIRSWLIALAHMRQEAVALGLLAR